jgi:hypothetical protein
MSFMKRSGESAKRNNSTDFELPDWSGMDDSPWRISIAEAFVRCGQVPEFVSQEAMRKWREQRAEKCEVEFVL